MPDPVAGSGQRGLAAADHPDFPYGERRVGIPVLFADPARIILTAGIAMFPFVMPSSTMMNASLTDVGCDIQPDDAEPDDLAAAVFVPPIILIYTSWCY